MKEEDLSYIRKAHQEHPKKANKAYRKWDGKTPYYTHPLWCATTILTETSLDETTRNEGAQVLLYHDLLEDTTFDLPSTLEERVRELIKEMTFAGGSVEEMQKIWERPAVIRLYKLYDKVSNLLDGSWMPEQKRQRYETYTQALCKDVERNYGTLNITKIARGILK